MNKRDLIKRATGILRENNIRKPISSQKYVFHISDDDGNTKDFIVKKNESGVIFTIDDVEAIMDACLCAVEEALKHGESISIRGFGTLGLNYRKARRTIHPETGEEVEVGARFVPKFSFGNDLRMCAKIYELSQDDKICELPPFDEGEDE